MKLTLDRELVAFDGIAIRFEGATKSQTLRTFAIYAVLNGGVEKLGGTEKYRRYEFARKLSEATEDTDWTVEELKLIKDSVGALPLPVAAVGAMYDAIEGK